MKLFSISLMLAFLIGNFSCMAGCPFYYNPDHNRNKDHGSIAGTVYNNGRPVMGQIQLLDAKTQDIVATEPINNSGHFIIQDVPAGGYFLAFFGPSSHPIGNMKYVKLSEDKPLLDVVFEITEKDPKVEELKKRIESEKENK